MVFEVPMLVGNVDDGSRCHDDDDDAVADVLQDFFHNFSFWCCMFQNFCIFAVLKCFGKLSASHAEGDGRSIYFIIFKAHRILPSLLHFNFICKSNPSIEPRKTLKTASG